MKKVLFLLAILSCTMVNAQKRISIDTWNGSDLTKYDGQQKDISMLRYMFNGWNTFCVPFDMTEEQIDAVFGSDCKVETLVGAEGDANDVTVYFDDVKSKGIEANKPYLVYFSGESKYLRVNMTGVIVKAKTAEAVSFKTADGTDVMLAGIYSRSEGLNHYGIPAKDNGEVNFVAITSEHNGIYPTRCSLCVSGSNFAKVRAMHGTPSGIDNVNMTNASEGTIYNIKGVKTNANEKGILIINGKKHINK